MSEQVLTSYYYEYDPEGFPRVPPSSEGVMGGAIGNVDPTSDSAGSSAEGAMASGSSGLVPKYDLGQNLIGYECGEVTSINLFETVAAPYHYEMTYSCSLDPEIPMDFIEQALLEEAAKAYKISPVNSSGCTIGPDDLDNWVLAVRTDPPDRLVPEYGGCVLLQPRSDECCAVVKGAMTFESTRDPIEQEFVWLVAGILDSTELTKGTSYTTMFRSEDEMELEPVSEISNDPPEVIQDGSPEDEARDRLTPSQPRDYGDQGSPAVVAAGGQEQPPPEDRDFTVIGALVTTALVLGVVGALLVWIRRRRRLAKSMDVSEAIHKSDLEYGSGRSGTSGSPRSGAASGSEDDGTYPMQTFDEYPSTFDDYANAFDEFPSSFDLDVTPEPPQSPSLLDRDEGDDLDDEPAGNVSPNGSYPSYGSGSYEYTFDLGNNFKNEIMGAYGSESGGGAGPTSMAVVSPYPLEDTSDSEADSWAQTEGTVGSLEERLEEITAEI